MITTSDVIRNEAAHAINGVPGLRFTLRVPPAPWKPGTFANQKWISESRPIKGYGKNASIQVEMRFDDNCRNGHNDFAITAEVRVPGRRDSVACGCLHEDIAQVFPELAPLIRWHLVSTDGPLHYIANTVHHASDCDHWGKRAGEPTAWEYGYRFDTSPITVRVKPGFYKWIEARRAFNDSTLKTNPAHGEFLVTAIAYDGSGDYKFAPKYTFVGYGQRWHECPFDDEAAAQEMAEALNKHHVQTVKTPTAFSEGKARDLNAARSVAVWPEATDAELMAPRAELEAALRARLPALLAAFRADMEAAGFMWEAPTQGQ